MHSLRTVRVVIIGGPPPFLCRDQIFGGPSGGHACGEAMSTFTFRMSKHDVSLVLLANWTPIVPVDRTAVD